MPEQDDWRLKQMPGADLVRGHTFTWKKWRGPNPSWDHDHCALCNQKLAEQDWPDVQHWGYADEKDYHWLCEECALAVKDGLNLTLLNGPESGSKTK
jgi:hypothetical protein